MTDRAFAAIVIACIVAFTLTLWLTRPTHHDPGPLRASCSQYGDLVYRQGARVVTVAIGHEECA